MSFLTSIFAPGEQQRSDDLDAQRIALEKRRADMGLISSDQADTNISKISSEREDVAGDLNTAFAEGAKEGYAATTGAIKTGLAAPFKFTWAILPWQVWAAGAVALFLYMGGGVYLRGIIARKAK